MKKNPQIFKMLKLSLLGRLSPPQGFHIKLANQSDIVARLSRGDVNMPNFCGFPVESQVAEVNFEVAVYMLLRSEPRLMVCRLLYHRIPVEHVGHSLDPPQDITGRRLFLFERAEGEKDVWRELSPDQQVHIPFLFIYSTHSFSNPSIFTHLDISLSLSLRIALLFRQAVSVHHCTDSMSRRALPTYGSVNACFNAAPNRDPSRSPSQLVPLANFALLCSNQRSER